MISPLAPVSSSIRLLKPVHVAPGCNDQILAALRTGKYGDEQTWVESTLHPKYIEEAHRSSIRFLFPQTEAPRHLILNPRLQQSWFKTRLAVVLDGRHEERWRNRGHLTTLDRPTSIAVSIDSKYGIELFLLTNDIAVLSVTIAIDHKLTPIDKVRDIHYHLSQTQFRAPVVRLPHHQTDPHLGSAAAPPIGREQALTDPLIERLGRAGQPFTLSEVCELLLKPIAGFLAESEQKQFFVHSVLRFEHTVDFTARLALDPAIQQVCAFAQIEEEFHPLASLGSPSVPAAVITSKHLAAYSTLGCCHFVADQVDTSGEAVPFNEQRVEVLQRKYFSAYLSTLLQRFVTYDCLEQAVSARTALQPLGAVWTRFSTFEASAQFIAFSRRDAVNRCFRLAQEAQCSLPALEMLHRLFHDTHQAEQAKRSNDLLHEQQVSGHRLRIIEAFIVTIYSAELIHLLGEAAEFEHLYVFAGILGGGLAGLWTVLAHHRRVVEGRKDPILVLAASLTLLGAWLLCGFLFARHPPDSEPLGQVPSAESPTQSTIPLTSQELAPPRPQGPTTLPGSAPATRPGKNAIPR